MLLFFRFYRLHLFQDTGYYLYILYMFLNKMVLLYLFLLDSLLILCYFLFYRYLFLLGYFCFFHIVYILFLYIRLYQLFHSIKLLQFDDIVLNLNDDEFNIIITIIKIIIRDVNIINNNGFLFFLGMSNISSRLILKSFDICFIKAISGIFFPFSHLLTAWYVTLYLFARSFWVRLFFSLFLL